MVDEHFGINIVEFMVNTALFLQKNLDLRLCGKAAGVIPLAHSSGGPLADIIVPLEGQRTG